MAGAYTKEEVASLYRRHVGMVYQICLMLLKNVPDAEDAVQTVFRKLLEYGRTLQGPEHEKAWLIVTARNECKNQLRHWWRTPGSRRGWRCTSTTTRGTAPGRRPGSWGRTPPPSAPGCAGPAAG